MSQRRGAQAPPGRPEPSLLFALGSGRATTTILVILLVLGAVGLGGGVLFGTDIEIEPVGPTPGPVPVALLHAPVPGLARLGQTPPPRSPTTSPGGASPIGDAGDQPGGRPVTFGPEDAGVMLVPDGWTVFVNDAERIVLANGEGVGLVARITRVEATTPATQLVAEVLERSVAGAGAAHVVASAVAGFQPFGRVVTHSAVGYSAVRSDQQGLASVGGNIFVFVRDDGLALEVVPEVAPALDWDDRIDDWFPLFERAASNFAGASLPT